MRLVNAKCPNCGANLKVYDTQKTLFCQFCGSSFVVEQAINNYYITNNVTVVNQQVNEGFEVVAGILKGYKGAAKDIVIPDNVLEIADSALEEIDGLTSVVISSNVRTIRSYAFYNCRDLKSVIIPNSVTKMEEGVFEGCSSLEKIYFPSSLTTIPSLTCRHCSSLSAVIIPDTVVSIGSFAFEYCKSLHSIVIPSSVTKIELDAFSGCEKLENVLIQGNPELESDVFLGTMYYGKQLSLKQSPPSNNMTEALKKLLKKIKKSP